MFEFCMNIGGVRHCFPVPTLIDPNVIRIPKPHNYPPFELAVSVLMLVQAVPASELSKQLSEAAHGFINQLKRELPKGVELVHSQGEHAASAR